MEKNPEKMTNQELSLKLDNLVRVPDLNVNERERAILRESARRFKEGCDVNRGFTEGDLDNLLDLDREHQ